MPPVKLLCCELRIVETASMTKKKKSANELLLKLVNTLYLVCLTNRDLGKSL